MNEVILKFIFSIVVGFIVIWGVVFSTLWLASIEAKLKERNRNRGS